MAILRSRGGRSFTTLPPMRMSPLVCFSSPAIIRSKVVLPQPLGPKRTRNSPSRVLKSTPSTAVWSWKTFRICFVSTMAMKEGGELQEFPLLPLLPDLARLRVRFLDRVLRRHRAGGRLGEHRVQHPGRVDLVDGSVGVPGESHIGGPLLRIREHAVLARRLPLLVVGQRLLEIRHLLGEGGKVVVLARVVSLVEVADQVDQELLRSVDVVRELPDDEVRHHVLEP